MGGPYSFSLWRGTCLPGGQVFLSETLPDHHFISGQFLSGIVDPQGNPSKTMAANADLFEIAKAVRASEPLSYDVIVTPSRFLMAKLRGNAAAAAVVAAIDRYLATCVAPRWHSADSDSLRQRRVHTALCAKGRPKTRRCQLLSNRFCMDVPVSAGTATRGTAWTSSSPRRWREHPSAPSTSEPSLCTGTDSQRDVMSLRTVPAAHLPREDPPALNVVSMQVTATLVGRKVVSSQSACTARRWKTRRRSSRR